jgi:hypothetical protein
MVVLSFLDFSADTFVDFDVGLNTAIEKLRDALGDDAENPSFRRDSFTCAQIGDWGGGWQLATRQTTKPKTTGVTIFIPCSIIASP